MRDGPAAAAEDGDILRALSFQLSHDFRKKFDVTAVVAGDADGGDIFLDSGADNVADVAMKPKINDLDAVADEFEIDRVDGAVVSIANRNSSENANG